MTVLLKQKYKLTLHIKSMKIEEMRSEIEMNTSRDLDL